MTQARWYQLTPARWKLLGAAVVAAALLGFLFFFWATRYQAALDAIPQGNRPGGVATGTLLAMPRSRTFGKFHTVARGVVMPQTVRRVLVRLGLLTTPLWLWPLGMWLAYHPWVVFGCFGGFLVVCHLFGCLAAVAALLVAPIVAGRRKRWLPALWAAGQAAVLLASFFGGLKWMLVVWRDRVEHVIAQSEPLVVAIHEFTAQHGRPPESLDELVPQHIAAVPTTGIGVHPQFWYTVGKPAVYDGNPWVLEITPVSPAMSFDSLMYFPRQNYPARGYGGGIERIGSWGYVHE